MFYLKNANEKHVLAHLEVKKCEHELTSEDDFKLVAIDRIEKTFSVVNWIEPVYAKETTDSIALQKETIKKCLPFWKLCPAIICNAALNGFWKHFLKMCKSRDHHN